MPRKLNLLPTLVRKATNFRVKVSDLDVNLHTNNVRYIKWVTDTYDLDHIHESYSGFPGGKLSC